MKKYLLILLLLTVSYPCWAMDAGSITMQSPTTYSSATAPKRSFFVSCIGMIPATTNGSAYWVKQETPSNQVNFYTSAFSGVTSQNIQFISPMPKSWDGGAVTAIIYYIPIGTSGGTDITWKISGTLIEDNTAADTAFGDAGTATDTIQTAGNIHISPESSAITIAGTLSGDKVIFWKIERDTTASNMDDAQLIGAMIKYTSNTETDN